MIEKTAITAFRELTYTSMYLYKNIPNHILRAFSGHSPVTALILSVLQAFKLCILSVSRVNSTEFLKSLESAFDATGTVCKMEGMSS